MHRDIGDICDCRNTRYCPQIFPNAAMALTTAIETRTAQNCREASAARVTMDSRAMGCTAAVSFIVDITPDPVCTSVSPLFMFYHYTCATTVQYVLPLYIMCYHCICATNLQYVVPLYMCYHYTHYVLQQYTSYHCT